jgi:hypothetical protein
MYLKTQKKEKENTKKNRKKNTYIPGPRAVRATADAERPELAGNPKFIILRVTITT